MEEIKKRIVEILWKSADTVHGAGSCGELGDSFKALDADLFNEVADEICLLFGVVEQSEQLPCDFLDHDKQIRTDGVCDKCGSSKPLDY
jgi:hypothetical protein